MIAAEKKYKVSCQMGNQGHSEHGSRRMVELIRAGTLGTVKEVHVWSTAPSGPRESGGRLNRSRFPPDWTGTCGSDPPRHGPTTLPTSPSNGADGGTSAREP